MELSIVLAVMFGMFLHSALLEVCNYLGYPVYTQEDREFIYEEVRKLF